MKYIIIALLAVLTVSCNTSKTIQKTTDTNIEAYTNGMKKAFGLWQQNKPMEAVALFERIGNVEHTGKEQKWLPEYYVANVLVTTSFREMDASKREQMLEKAKTFIAKAHESSPGNAEIYTLEGMLYTSYVALDASTYGMKLSGKIAGLHQKALALDDKNPRALANLTEFEMGTAKFFGKDLAPYCERMKTILPLFDVKKYDYPFAPSWGKGRAETVAKNCGK